MRSFTQNPLLMLSSGFAVWGLGFVLLYALQALGCAYHWPLHRPILVATFVICLLPLGVLAFQSPPPTESEKTALWTAARWANRGAFAAAILVFAPVLFASICV